MKSNEFIKKTHHRGTYAGVRFSESTQDDLKKWMIMNQVPNPVPSDKLHTTLLYSRKRCPNYVPRGPIAPAYTAQPGNFEIWPSQDGNNCLVLTFECPELVQRHKDLMQEHGATFDYPEYKTHVTLSYNVGDLTTEDLPAYEGLVEIVEEYGEELDLDWAQNNANG